MNQQPDSFKDGQLARGAILRVVQTLSSSVIAFFMMPFLIRHLGSHWYCIWVAVGSMTASYYLLDFGLSSAVTRYIAIGLAEDDRERVAVTVSTALMVYSLLALVLVIITIAVALASETVVSAQGDAPTVRHVVLIVGFALAAEFPFKAFAGIMQARLRYDLMTISRLTFSLTSSGLIALLVWYGYGIVAMAYVGLASGIGSNLAFVTMARSMVPWLLVGRRSFDWAMFRELWSFSVWSFVVQIANLLRFRIDALVVGGLYSAVAVTHYAAGARLSELADNLQRQTSNLIQPLLTRFYALGRGSEMRRLVLFVTRLNAASGAFVTAQILILGEPFFHRWLGRDFVDAAPIAYLLSIAMLIGFVAAPLNNIFYVVARHRTLAAASLIEALLNLGCSIGFGIWLGPVGVAWGTVVPALIVRLGWTVPASCRYAELPSRQLMSSLAGVLWPASLFLLVYGLVVRMLIRPTTYGGFFIVGAASAVVYVAFMLGLVFEGVERNRLWRELGSVLRL